MRSDPFLFHGRAVLATALALVLAACALLPSLAEAEPLTPSPTSVHFFPEAVGAFSSPEHVGIVNRTGNIVSIAQMGIVGADAGDFDITGGDCGGASLFPGIGCQTEVTFTPHSTGAKSAVLEFQVLGVPTPIEVPLTGTGVTRHLTVPAGAALPTATLGAKTTAQIPLKNESEDGLKITELKFEGADAGDFGIEGGDCSGQLEPAQTCTLTVSFTPTALGPREASLKLISDAVPNESLVALSGEGAAPELTFEPASFDFGPVEVRGGGARTTLTLRNTGAGAVQLNNPQIVGPDSDEFWIPSNSCSGINLAPAQTCSLEVQFNANEEGSAGAAVQIIGGSTNFEAALSGRAEHPVVTPSPVPLVFGQTTVGASQTELLTLTNEGHIPVGFFLAFISGGEVADFKLVEENCTGEVFQPGESCSARISFAPTSAGGKAATMSFFGGGEGVIQVPIEGTAVPPAVSLTPSTYDFGAVSADSLGPVQVFQLRNESADPYAVESVSLKGADPGEFSIRSDQCAEAMLEPGESCAVAIRFEPSSDGASAATLRLRGEAGTITAGLSGEGRPAVSAAPAAGSAEGGRVVLHFNRHPRAAGGRLTLGRARCESLQSCTITLSGRPGTRPMTAVRISLEPGSSAPLVIRLPAWARASPPPARIAVAVRWQTGTALGGRGRSFALAA